MKHHIVIDTSVYITYANYGKLYRIVNAVELFNLALFIDDHLLKKFERNLKRLSLKKQIDVEEGMILLKMMSIKIVTIPIFTNSPDPKDNFLFDPPFKPKVR
jgi:predicted nucleic acid-binding protein